MTKNGYYLPGKWECAQTSHAYALPKLEHTHISHAYALPKPVETSHAYALPKFLKKVFLSALFFKGFEKSTKLIIRKWVIIIIRITKSPFRYLTTT
jgi:hypothetical protein